MSVWNLSKALRQRGVANISESKVVEGKHAPIYPLEKNVSTSAFVAGERTRPRPAVVGTARRRRNYFEWKS